jgi:hypothetical protein
MRNTTLCYLFLETLALLMVLQIFFGNPHFSLLSSYERFGYATAALGLSLGLSLLITRRYKLEPGTQPLITVLCYPFLLFAVSTAVENSTKLLPQDSRAFALTQGIKVLAKGEYKHADFNTQFTRVSLDYPIKDALIRQMHLDTIRGMAAFMRQQPVWSEKFSEAALQGLDTAMIYKSMDSNKMQDNLAAATGVSGLFALLSPFTARTAAHVGLAQQKDDMVLPFIASTFFNKLPLSDNDRYAYINYVAEKRLLASLQVSLAPIKIHPHLAGKSWKDTLRESLTSHILDKAGLPVADNQGYFAFPWRQANKAYNADIELSRIVSWAAPFLLAANGKLVIPLSDLKNEQRVKQLEQHFLNGLHDTFRNNFNLYYRNTAQALVTQPELWRSPLAEPLYSHFLRIGVVMPALLVLSVVLLLVNYLRVARKGKESAVLGLVSIGLAVAVFNSSLLYWIMQPVLLISTREPMLFVN